MIGYNNVLFFVQQNISSVRFFTYETLVKLAKCTCEYRIYQWLKHQSNSAFYLIILKLLNILIYILQFLAGKQVLAKIQKEKQDPEKRFSIGKTYV